MEGLAAEDAAGDLTGRVLEERYRVLERLARGGMSTVYAAVDLRLDRKVALKVPHASLASDPGFLARFIGEAKVAARLSHPHVVGVYDQGTTVMRDGPEGPEVQLVFLVMEYVDGRTLRDEISARERFSAAEALQVFSGIASALAAAHSAGVVHRDVKPENVLLGDDGTVKVADFGLARAGGGGTAENVLLGTASYIAPEQIRGLTADERSDVYSAGIVLYEMLTGKPPYVGEDATQVAARHVEEDVPPPSAMVADVPQELDELVFSATRRDPDRRPANGVALLTEVQRLGHGLLPPGATPLRPSADRGVAPEESVSSTTMLVPLPSADSTAMVPLPSAGSTPEPDSHRTMALPRMAASAKLAQPLTVESVPTGDPGSAPPPGWKGPAAVLGAAIALALGVWLFLYGPFAYTAVPALVGLSSAEAQQKAEEAGLKVRMVSEFDEAVPAGQVASTDPAPGSRISRNGTIRVVMSKGKERYEVPDLRGRDLAEAREELASANLELGEQRFEYSDTTPKDRIISTRPASGASVRRGTPVDVAVSQGPPPIAVPDVRGQPVAVATQALQAAQLQVRTTTRKDPVAPAGAVIEQDPAPNTRVEPNRVVTLTVSEGPEVVIVPDVGNQPIPQAEQMLRGAGFDVRRSGPEVFGVARNTQPRAGTEARKGSLVILQTL